MLSFASTLGLGVVPTYEILKIDTPYVCVGDVRCVLERVVVVDLTLIDMSGFDVIIGKDWLANYQAIIDRDRLRVTLYPTSEPTHLVHFTGDRKNPTSSRGG